MRGVSRRAPSLRPRPWSRRWHVGTRELELYYHHADSLGNADPRMAACTQRVLDGLAPYGLLPWSAAAAAAGPSAATWGDGGGAHTAPRRNVLVVHEIHPTAEHGGNVRLRQVGCRAYPHPTPKADSSSQP